MNNNGKQRESLNLQVEAATLLASEMSEIKGGTLSTGCGSSTLQPERLGNSEGILPSMGCSSCNKGQSCQTHT